MKPGFCNEDERGIIILKDLQKIESIPVQPLYIPGQNFNGNTIFCIRDDI